MGLGVRGIRARSFPNVMHRTFDRLSLIHWGPFVGSFLSHHASLILRYEIAIVEFILLNWNWERKENMARPACLDPLTQRGTKPPWMLKFRSSEGFIVGTVALAVFTVRCHFIRQAIHDSCFFVTHVLPDRGCKLMT